MSFFHIEASLLSHENRFLQGFLPPIPAPDCESSSFVSDSIEVAACGWLVVTVRGDDSCCWLSSGKLSLYRSSFSFMPASRKLDFSPRAENPVISNQNMEILKSSSWCYLRPWRPAGRTGIVAWRSRRSADLCDLEVPEESASQTRSRCARESSSRPPRSHAAGHDGYMQFHGRHGKRRLS